MKTLSLTPVLLLALLTPGLRANDCVYRELDIQATAASSDARLIRWEIRDHFGASPRYDALLCASRDLLTAIRDVEDLILDEDTFARMCAATATAEHELHELQRLVDACGVSSRGGVSTTWSRGRPVSIRRVGDEHLAELHRLVDRLEHRLDGLHQTLDLLQASRRPIPRPGIPAVVIPHGQSGGFVPRNVRPSGPVPNGYWPSGVRHEVPQGDFGTKVYRIGDRGY